MISRRGFFGRLCGAVVAISCPEPIIAALKSVSVKSAKENIIAQAIASEEGKRAFAQSMAELIRRSLEYQSVGRKLLMVDELPNDQTTKRSIS